MTADSPSYYIETYGCQMNVADSEIVDSILGKAGMQRISEPEGADAILINTCAIRDKAEGKIWTRLRQLRATESGKQASIAVLGCMAERLKTKLLETDRLVDVVVGPDAYRDLPSLLEKSFDGHTGVNVALSLEETYADVAPLRTFSNGVSAFVSIMRGCNNLCSYCIVPLTRGRERSRDYSTILGEIKDLSDQGFKEVMLLGQNVNSYNDKSAEDSNTPTRLNEGFANRCKVRDGGMRFAELLSRVAQVDPQMRIRFTSPHPKDMNQDVVDVVAAYPNICNQFHIPAQSGSSAVLENMKRGYTREAYMGLVDKIRTTIPNASLSSDFISGFCGETEEDHQQTLSLLREVEYDHSFMFAYSTRERTFADRHLEDNVPEDVKKRRLMEVMETFGTTAKNKAARFVGNIETVLVEGNSRRGDDVWSGRSDGNRRVLFDKTEGDGIHPGAYATVEVISANRSTLFAKLVEKTEIPTGCSVLQQALSFD